MAALTRSTKANYTLHERISMNTSDREEHTFCGVMFPIQCKEILPIDHIVITSIAVRGALGPITIWVNKTSSSSNSSSSSNQIIDTNPHHWKCIYQKQHPPSFRQFINLDISDQMLKLSPGQVRGIYIHSTLPGDQAIVYDNHYGHLNQSDTPQDNFIKIRPALAHVSETPFGSVPIWGWGDAWRHDRKFVGRVNYGVVYKLWHPRQHLTFGSKFQQLTLLLFACQRRLESPISRLGDDLIFYILHLCKWDWMGDGFKEMEEGCLCRKRRELEDLREQRINEREKKKKEAVEAKKSKSSDGNACSRAVSSAAARSSSSCMQEDLFDSDDEDDEDWHDDHIEVDEYEDIDHEDDNEDSSEVPDSEEDSENEYMQAVVTGTNTARRYHQYQNVSYSTVLFDPSTLNAEYDIDSLEQDDSHEHDLTLRRRSVWLRRFRRNNSTGETEETGARNRGMHLFTLLRSASGRYHAPDNDG